MTVVRPLPGLSGLRIFRYKSPMISPMASDDSFINHSVATTTLGVFNHEKILVAGLGRGPLLDLSTIKLR